MCGGPSQPPSPPGAAVQRPRGEASRAHHDSPRCRVRRQRRPGSVGAVRQRSLSKGGSGSGSGTEADVESPTPRCSPTTSTTTPRGSPATSTSAASSHVDDRLRVRGAGPGSEWASAVEALRQQNAAEARRARKSEESWMRFDEAKLEAAKLNLYAAQDEDCVWVATDLQQLADVLQRSAYSLYQQAHVRSVEAQKVLARPRPETAFAEAKRLLIHDLPALLEWSNIFLEHAVVVQGLRNVVLKSYPYHRTPGLESYMSEVLAAVKRDARRGHDQLGDALEALKAVGRIFSSLREDWTALRHHVRMRGAVHQGLHGVRALSA